MPSSLLLIVAAGCSVSDEGDGKSSLSVRGDGVKIDVKDSDGKESKVSVDGAHVDISGGDSHLKMDVGDGKFSMKAGDKDSSFQNNVHVTEDMLGVPLYPGSTEVLVGSMIAESRTQKTAISCRSTSDSPEKVTAFYRDHLSETFTATKEEGGRPRMELKGRDKDGNEVDVSASREKDSENTTVTVVRVIKLK